MQKLAEKKGRQAGRPKDDHPLRRVVFFSNQQRRQAPRAARTTGPRAPRKSPAGDSGGDPGVVVAID